MQLSKLVAKVSAVATSAAVALGAFAANAQVGTATGLTAGGTCANGGTPPLCIPSSSSVGGLKYAGIAPVILQVITIGLGVAGTVAVLFLIVGGFLYITAAGDEQRLEKAKTTLKNAIIGTIFILLALVIVITIQNFLA